VNDEVFILWHVHHAPDDDGRIGHVDEGGEVRIDEEFGDDVKLLGVYSSDALAKERIDSAKHLPGFSDEPDCFMIDKYKINNDEWSEGFVTQ